MKPLYFAKYLPVEGEESGKPSGTIVTYGQPISPNATEYLGKLLRKDTGWDMYETLKLFLCSRDIQVGDKVVHPEFGERIVISDEDFNSDHKMKAFRESGNWCHIYAAKEFHFKVIGEISSDALSYVKEGDEFDENSINLQWYDDSGVDNPWINYIPLWDWSELPDKFKRVQIKGPCSHFH